MTRGGRGLLAAIAAASLCGCVRDPGEPLSIAANGIWPGYQPLFLARDLGYLDQVPARVHEMPSSSLALAAFRNRSVESAALTLDEALLLMQGDTDVRLILALDVSNGADAVVARPEIGSLRQIRGKRVGAESTALGAYVLSRALERAGLSPADVQVVPVAIDQHEQAYREGRVDVVVTFDPVRTRLLVDGAGVLFDSSQIPGEIVDVLVVRGDLLRTRSRQVVRLRDAWYRALDHLRASPEDSCRRIAPREGLSCAEFQASLKGIAIPDRAENERLLAGKTPALLAPAERLAGVMLGSGLLRAPVDARRLFGIAPPDRRGRP